jgi:hypothetical protein
MGPQPGFVSFGNVEDGKRQPAWNLLGLYDQLWDELGESITPMHVSPAWLDDHAEDFSLILSSVPLHALCRQREPVADKAAHRFDTQEIRIRNGMCHGGRIPNTVFYNGSRDVMWYRASFLFGVASTEYGVDGFGRLARVLDQSELDKYVSAKKPVGHTCSCDKPDHFVPIGRFGKWVKGVLVDHSFQDSVRALHERGMVPQLNG